MFGMISCTFEHGAAASLRHVVTHAIVEKDGSILLVKRAPHLSEGGKWALPGGYLDRDETAQQGALRELLEETGWKGSVDTLFRINTNPNRPKEDRQNVVLEFIVHPMEKVAQADSESVEVAWIPLDSLVPASEIAFDHAESIRLYREYRSARFPLPLLV